MTTPAIQVEHLSKRYRLGGMRSLDASLREAIHAAAGGAWRKLRGRDGDGEDDRTLWALRDVSFTVEPGEVLGIIGRNGAGKSTLLKILSRITDPTDGDAYIRGRVGSLLEVGTGFHPELTGRENIFLNAAVLGMSKREVRGKFDQIVDFAEIDRFIDTPVKRYSSGMYVRLAFAVAAHLQPQVLIVDEVLAVGDAAFQKKCLGKMNDVAKQGRTILFVSHNMAAVRSLCHRAVLLDGGRVAHAGSTEDVVNRYLDESQERGAIRLAERTDRGGDGRVCLTDVSIENARAGEPITSSSRLKVTIGYDYDGPLRHAQFLVGVYDSSNTGLYLLDTDAAGQLPDELPPRGSIVCYTDAINLTPGRCFVNIALKRAGAVIDHVGQAASFNVEADGSFNLRYVPSRNWVMCLLRQQWEVHAVKAA